MKVLVCLSVLCLLGLVYGETCSQNSVNTDCTHMTCESGWHKTCVQGQCTCTQDTGAMCTTKAECDAMDNLPCSERRRHCIDGTCRCTRF